MVDVTQLARRLSDGDVVFLDGAIGTELERLGVEMHSQVWCAEAIETHPHLITEVHRSYLEAGAQVITTNTYATQPSAMSAAGLADRNADWDRRAVLLAMDARSRYAGDNPVYVAGSLSTFGTTERALDSAMLSGFSTQAERLVDAGVDLLLIETLAAPPERIEAAVAATEGAGLPVWLAISCLAARDSNELLLGVEESRAHSNHQRDYGSFEKFVRRCNELPIDALLMMHSDFAVTSSAVDCLHANFDGPVGVYPNAGYWLRPQWAFVDQLTPAAFATATQEWINKGAGIVGGCCGIGPEHIRAAVALHAGQVR